MLPTQLLLFFGSLEVHIVYLVSSFSILGARYFFQQRFLCDTDNQAMELTNLFQLNPLNLRDYIQHTASASVSISEKWGFSTIMSPYTL